MVQEAQPSSAPPKAGRGWKSAKAVGVVVIAVSLLASGIAIGANRFGTRSNTSVPQSVPVSLLGRINVDGVSYDGSVYVPAKAVEDGFDLEAAQTKDGGLNLANSISRPRVLAKHDPLGPWLGEETISVEKWDKVQMDPSTGLPKTVYDQGAFFYPVTVAHYGLESYSKWAVNHKDADWKKAVLVADWLLANQDSRGGVPVPFDHVFRKGVTAPLKAGWYSGMAQGMIADLFAKVYAKTQDERYREAALKSLNVLSIPVSQGGVQRKFENKYEWWEEYPTADHPTYVLNGFIYAVIGVYDVAKILENEHAQTMYESGLRSLARMMNLYDLGNRTAYDLLHYSVPGTPPNIARWGYHNTHVLLLSALNAITDGQFAAIQKRWLGYVNGVTAPHN